MDFYFFARTMQRHLYGTPFCSGICGAQKPNRIHQKNHVSAEIVSTGVDIFAFFLEKWLWGLLATRL